MATASLMKANQLMLSKRRQNFNGNVTFTGPRFSSVIKVQNFGNLTSGVATTRNNASAAAAAAAVPFRLKAQFRTSSTNMSPLKKPVIYYIFETLNWLKSPAVVMLHSMLLLLMMTKRGGDALACTSPWIGRHEKVFKENSKMFMAEDIERRLHNLSTGSGRNIVKEDAEANWEPRPFKEDMFCFFLLFVIPICLIIDEKFGESRTKVIKLQVALSVIGGRLIWTLNSIATSGDSSTSDGLKNVLRRTAQAFSSKSDCWMAAYTSVRLSKSLEDAEKSFKKLEIEERGKFDEDLVYQNKEKKRSDMDYDFLRRNHVVVTFVVAGKGKGFHGFPNSINDKKGLSKALEHIQIISEFGEIQGISIWSTPREEMKILPLKDIKENYPLLSMFSRRDRFY